MWIKLLTKRLLILIENIGLLRMGTWDILQDFETSTESSKNKDENAHRFALIPLRGKLWREKEREERKKEVVLEYYTRVTYYP